MKRLIYILAALPLLLTGCKKDDRGGASSSQGIRFEIGIDNGTRVATDAAFNSTFETGDQIGVFAVRHAAGMPGTLAASGNFMHNVKLTYDGTNWIPDAGPEIYYPGGTDVLDFYAYYPYDVAATDPTAIVFSAKTDQSGVTNIGGTDKSNYNLSDLLTATPAMDVARSTTAVPLTFVHRLALVEVDITNKDVNVPQYDATLTVSLTGVQITQSFSLGTSPSVPANTGSVTMCRVDMGDANKYVYRALVPAQLVLSGDLMISQTTANSAFDFGHSLSSVSLTEATAHRYDLSVGWGVDPDHVYVIGDVYPHAGPVVGVVYSITNGGKNGQVVSLDEENTDQGSGKYGVRWDDGYYDVSAANSLTDGRANMAAVSAYIAASSKEWTNFPAFKWVVDKNGVAGVTGPWYLPAIGELSDLCTSREAVNATLSSAGGTTLDTSTWPVYWSSSQVDGGYARHVLFGPDITDLLEKTYSCRVRAVRTF